MDKRIDDKFLYAYIPQAEQIMLSRIPAEKELSHKFSRRFKKKMKALLKYERRSPAMRRFAHWLKIAAAILLAVLSLSFGFIMCVEAYRTRLFEILVRVEEELTSLFIYSEEITGDETLILKYPAYIPKGYSVIEQTDTMYTNLVIYGNESGNEICYLQKMIGQGEFIFDTENAETRDITIGTAKGFIILNKGIVQIFWYDDFNTYSLIGNLDENEMIKMAESIK